MFVKSIAVVVLFVALSSAQQPEHAANHTHHHHTQEVVKDHPNASLVKIDVYYESLCADSAKFVTTQLYPLISDQSKDSLAHSINLNLVPFGKSNLTRVNDTVKLECHHGDEECTGNKYQACALNHIENRTVLYQYINCTMTEGPMHRNSNYSTGKMCAETLKLDHAADLETCVHSDQSFDLLDKYANLTKKINITSVPTVTFNGVYDVKEQAQALVDLTTVVCSKVANASKLYADKCKAPKNSAPSVMGASLVTMIAAMVVSRLH